MVGESASLQASTASGRGWFRWTQPQSLVRTRLKGPFALSYPLGRSTGRITRTKHMFAAAAVSQYPGSSRFRWPTFPPCVGYRLTGLYISVVLGSRSREVRLRRRVNEEGRGREREENECESIYNYDQSIQYHIKDSYSFHTFISQHSIELPRVAPNNCLVKSCCLWH